jgi:UPF0755 protein
VRVVVVIGLLLLPFVLGIGWFAYQLRPGSSGPAVTITLSKDHTGASDVAGVLAEKGVIGSALAFKLWATISGAGPFQAGCHDLHEGLGVRGAASLLAQAGGTKVGGKCVVAGNEPDVKLFLPPGQTLTQIAERVGKVPGHTAAGFLAVANSGTIRSKYQPPEVTSLEGLLFPDTYFIGPHWTDEQVVQLLVNQFDRIADKVGLANAQGLTPYQVVVTASLIQTEAKLAEDAPLISAVIHNRLAAGTPLQVDSTLCYAKGGCPPIPTDADKAIDSPYNTYKIPGLPPTPIASVTQASLQAALAPAAVPYLYYVIADANGKHAFATTLQEHERNIAAARAKGLL